MLYSYWKENLRSIGLIINLKCGFISLVSILRAVAFVIKRDLVERNKRLGQLLSLEDYLLFSSRFGVRFFNKGIFLL